MNKHKLQQLCKIVILLKKQLVITVEIFFGLVLRSFDPPKGAILKNYSMFYFDI